MSKRLYDWCVRHAIKFGIFLLLVAFFLGVLLPARTQMGPRRIPSQKQVERRIASVIGGAGIVLIIVGIIAGVCALKREEREAAGLCPFCGYDLRASKERCPECGLAIIPQKRGEP